MRIELSDDAAEFGRVVRDALGSAGGDELIQRAEADPGRREALVEDVLGRLGLWDLDVRGDGEHLEAAAAACRSVGWWAAPGAVAERLARPTGLDADALAVVGGPRPSAPVHGSTLRWVAVDLDGRRSAVTARPLATTARTATFVAEVDLAPIDDGGADDVLAGLVLPCWTLLGMLDRAIAVTAGYVTDRQQFGKPLSAFQAVQFQLTEAEVERAGLEQLAKYALWSMATQRPEAPVDSLALRLAAIEAAETAFRICHQLHGAIGFCDEATISWLSRYSLPIRRLPLPLSGTRDELVRRAGRGGLVGLYGGTP
jgi:3-oxo-4-pregnene-20-carboxyl-CoA dehydrogenase alpha subunit